jgi:hypothetical protein
VNCSELINVDSLFCDCADIRLNVRTINRFTVVDEYYIWQKFHVSVTRKMDLSTEDSCYYSIVEDKLNQKMSIDSIVNLLTNLSDQDISSKVSFYDRRYSSLINSETFNGTRARPIIGEDVYYSQLDSLSNNIQSTKDINLLCWISINSQGVVDKIEITNYNCKKELISTVSDFFKKLHWIPAMVNGEKVDYRFKEEVFIKHR